MKFKELEIHDEFYDQYSDCVFIKINDQVAAYLSGIDAGFECRFGQDEDVDKLTKVEF